MRYDGTAALTARGLDQTGLLKDLRRQVALLEVDLRVRAGEAEEFATSLRAEYERAREAGRTAAGGAVTRLRLLVLPRHPTHPNATSPNTTCAASYPEAARPEHRRVNITWREPSSMGTRSSPHGGHLLLMLRWRVATASSALHRHNDHAAWHPVCNVVQPRRQDRKEIITTRGSISV